MTREYYLISVNSGYPNVMELLDVYIDEVLKKPSLKSVKPFIYRAVNINQLIKLLNVHFNVNYVFKGNDIIKYY